MSCVLSTDTLGPISFVSVARRGYTSTSRITRGGYLLQVSYLTYQFPVVFCRKIATLDLDTFELLTLDNMIKL